MGKTGKSVRTALGGGPTGASAPLKQGEVRHERRWPTAGLHAARRSSPPRFTLVAATVLGWLSAAALTGASLAALALEPLVRRPDPARPPVEVGDVVPTVRGDGRTVRVEVEVTNSQSRVEKAKTWWILSRAGAGPPWAERRVYTSGIESYGLAPGHTTRLLWSEHVSVAPGAYELWAFTHVEKDGVFVHSDGRVGVRPLVLIGPAGSAASRPRPDAHGRP